MEITLGAVSHWERLMSWTSALVLLAPALWAGSVVAQVWPAHGWAMATHDQVGVDPLAPVEARDDALPGCGSGKMVRIGSLVYS